MAWNYYYNDDDNYESRADAALRVEKELQKRRKRGEALEPVLPSAGRDLSTTFWGQAWNKNLMSYSDYESRMPRGRTYFRGGKVLGLAIEGGAVRSVVAGTSLYDVAIAIKPLPKERWADLKKRCSGKIGSLMELLAGKLSAEVMREVTDLDHGLFPAPREITLSCSCPDWADMCKHCAATLYAVGAKLDAQPELLFTLRGIDPTELTGHAAEAVEALTAPAPQAGDRRASLAGVDLSGIFGIELAGMEALEEILATERPKEAAPGKSPRRAAAAAEAAAASAEGKRRKKAGKTG